MTEEIMRRFAIGLLLVGGVACGPPVLNTPVEEVPKLTKLEDVMANQSTVMDPLFKKMDEPSFTDEDWAAITAAAAKVQATSLHIKDFSKGPEFDGLAVRLNSQAGALASSYAGKDVNAAKGALHDMKATCKECHKKFR
jgi:soluble cytochrome b562